jgi:hypothetical protein
MKYYLDTEFIEGFKKPLFSKKRHFIDMISIGIVDENGKELYLVSSDYNYNDADKWVKDNVILPMYISMVHGDERNRMDVTNFHKFKGYPLSVIRDNVCAYFGIWRDQYFLRAPEGIEVYAYYADYDWVLFCSALFGRMIDLPKGFPMYCRDLKQELDNLADSFTEFEMKKYIHRGGEMSGPIIAMLDANNLLAKEGRLTLLKEHKNYPKQTEEHDALADAKWNYQLHRFINSFKKMHNVSE